MTGRQQPRIAILLDRLEADYHVELLSGALRAIRSTNANALIVPGGGICEEHATSNFVYDDVPPAVDGVLFLSGTLSHRCRPDDYVRWLERFSHLRTIHTGLAVEGQACLRVDNHVGMYAAISHLIEVHGRTKIGFVRGPAGSLEADERYNAYVKALDDHGLRVDPRIVFLGERFGREDGHAAVDEMFSRRGLNPTEIDALGCVNDDSALGVLEALKPRGISVPDQLALVGFDDAPNARAANPPLTTIDQRVEEQGFLATEHLLAAIQNGLNVSDAHIESRLVTRGSCGCRAVFRNDSRRSGDKPPASARPLALALLGNRDAWRNLLTRVGAARIQFQPGWEGKLLQGLSDELTGHQGAFPAALEKVARRAVLAGDSVDPCNEVLTTLRLEMVKSASDVATRAQLEDTFQEARLMLADVALGAYRERSVSEKSHMRNITRACLETLASGDPRPMLQGLRAHLPSLGIEVCTITAMSSDKGGTREYRVIGRVGERIANSSNLTLPAESLAVDSTLEHRAVVIVLPLEFGGKSVGLASCSWGAYNPIHYELLRELLGAAVYGCRSRG